MACYLLLAGVPVPAGGATGRGKRLGGHYRAPAALLAMRYPRRMRAVRLLLI